jgi:hypothetical protein
MRHIKTVKVTNPKNVVVQLPGHLIERWGVQQGDGMEVYTNETEEGVYIKPKKRYVRIRAGSDSNTQS